MAAVVDRGCEGGPGYDVAPACGSKSGIGAARSSSTEARSRLRCSKQGDKSASFTLVTIFIWSRRCLAVWWSVVACNARRRPKKAEEALGRSARKRRAESNKKPAIDRILKKSARPPLRTATQAFRGQSPEIWGCPIAAKVLLDQVRPRARAKARARPKEASS